jgi:hypothetical protein
LAGQWSSRIAELLHASATDCMVVLPTRPLEMAQTDNHCNATQQKVPLQW